MKRPQGTGTCLLACKWTRDVTVAGHQRKMRPAAHALEGCRGTRWRLGRTLEKLCGVNTGGVWGGRGLCILCMVKVMLRENQDCICLCGLRPSITSNNSSKVMCNDVFFFYLLGIYINIPH